jgi:hypothetical protein
MGREIMRKRNKKTTIISKLELSGLTEHILAGMGEEGRNLRERLMRFLEERTVADRQLLKKASPGGPMDISQP